ncbi:MAG: methyl-accepting chemotaxis protein [Tepidibacillus sp.]
MGILKNMNVAKKIFILIAFSVLFLLVVGITGYLNMNQMAKKSNEMYEDRLLAIKYLSESLTNQYRSRGNLLEFMLVKDMNKKDKLKTQIEELRQTNNQLFSHYKNTKLDPFELEKIEELNKENEVFRQEQDKILGQQQFSDEVSAYNYFNENVVTKGNKVRELTKELVDYNTNLADQLADENNRNFKQSTIFVISITLLSIILSLAIGTLIIRMIVKPLQEMQSKMVSAQAGDLTVEGSYQSKDEIGLLTKAFNQMIQGLRELINKVNESSINLSSNSNELSAITEQTSEATQQITTAIEQMATGAEHQLNSAKESSTSMEEMAVGIQRIAESSSIVSESSIVAAKEAEEGNQAIQKVVKQMNTISASVEDSAIVVRKLGNRSKEIEQIVGVITGIAEQTNLLALNAAIEAARAGEHGRGFAVVADEVRKLAEQSRVSADQITSLIHEIQIDTDRAVQSMQTGTTEVETGMSIVANAGEGFQRILQAIEKVNDQIQEVSAVSEQMSAGSEQVAATVESVATIAEQSNQSAQNISSSSQEQMAAVEEISSSAIALSKLADELQELVAKFKI